MDDERLEERCARALIDESSLLVVALDDDLEVRWANAAATARLDEAGVGAGPRRSLLQLVHPDDLAIVGAGLATKGNVTAHGERAATRNASVVVRLADGAGGWSAMQVSGVWADTGSEPLLIVVARDVSARHAATTALGMAVDGAPLPEVLGQLAESFRHQLGPVELTVLVEDRDDPLFRTAAAGRTGWTMLDVPSVHDLVAELAAPRGRGVTDLPVPDDDDWSMALLLPGGDGPAGLVVVEGSGMAPTPLWVRESTGALRDLVAVALVQDANRAELERRVVTYPLTGLLNRSGLAAELDGSAGRRRAVLDVGAAATEELGARIVERLCEDVAVAGLRLRIGASVGCSVAAGGSDADALLLSADRMLYHAKRSGGRRLALASLDA